MQNFPSQLFHNKNQKQTITNPALINFKCFINLWIINLSIQESCAQNHWVAPAQGRLSLSSFCGRLNEYLEFLGTKW